MNNRAKYKIVVASLALLGASTLFAQITTTIKVRTTTSTESSSADAAATQESTKYLRDFKPRNSNVYAFANAILPVAGLKKLPVRLAQVDDDLLAPGMDIVTVQDDGSIKEKSGLRSTADLAKQVEELKQALQKATAMMKDLKTSSQQCPVDSTEKPARISDATAQPAQITICPTGVQCSTAAQSKGAEGAPTTAVFPYREKPAVAKVDNQYDNPLLNKITGDDECAQSLPSDPKQALEEALKPYQEIDQVYQKLIHSTCYEADTQDPVVAYMKKTRDEKWQEVTETNAFKENLQKLSDQYLACEKCKVTAAQEPLKAMFEDVQKIFNEAQQQIKQHSENAALSVTDKTKAIQSELNNLKAKLCGVAQPPISDSCPAGEHGAKDVQVSAEDTAMVEAQAEDVMVVTVPLSTTTPVMERK